MITKSDKEPQFFVSGGGTMGMTVPSYVERSADQELLQNVINGNFCYVLTPRQMGKSSLMVRTNQLLIEHDIKSVIIDLSWVGKIPIDQWYMGLLTYIKKHLALTVDVGLWWEQHQALGEPQRFSEFLHDEVLKNTSTRVVIFIDEIDTILELQFRDDFFATIRALYNNRPTEPIYNRISFVLLGVATPTELIRNPSRTPFNIGHKITLKEFSYAEASILKQGLEMKYPKQGDIILNRIFYWTNGHPYLTQKICQDAVDTPVNQWDNEQVDKLVEANFFSLGDIEERNIKPIRDRIEEMPPSQRRSLLQLYKRVYKGNVTSGDDRSHVQNQLELIGLICTENSKLRVRNEIYRTIFNETWIKRNMPVNKSRSTILFSSLTTLLLIAVIAWFFIVPVWFGLSGQIAFVSSRDGNDEIYVMNADGTNLLNLTNNSGTDTAPVWSPDKNSIVFVSSRDGNDEIYVMNVDGTNLLNLTNSSILTNTANNPITNTAPVWSPDGNFIAFVSSRDGNDEIYVMNADGTNLLNLTNSSILTDTANNPITDTAPVWSPDGNSIAFVSSRDGNDEIYVMNADGTNLLNLTNDSGTDTIPIWDPDGNSIAFVSSRDGNDEIYVMNADGTNLLNLTNNPATDTNPVWSPDGHSIAFVSSRNGNDDIYMMNADGTDLLNLTNNPATDTAPVWSPDGYSMAFVSSRNGNDEIYIMLINNSFPIDLTSFLSRISVNLRNITNKAGDDVGHVWMLKPAQTP